MACTYSTISVGSCEDQTDNISKFLWPTPFFSKYFLHLCLRIKTFQEAPDPSSYLILSCLVLSCLILIYKYVKVRLKILHIVLMVKFVAKYICVLMVRLNPTHRVEQATFSNPLAQMWKHLIKSTSHSALHVLWSLVIHLLSLKWMALTVCTRAFGHSLTELQERM